MEPIGRGLHDAESAHLAAFVEPGIIESMMEAMVTAWQYLIASRNRQLLMELGYL